MSGVYHRSRALAPQSLLAPLLLLLLFISSPSLAIVLRGPILSPLASTHLSIHDAACGDVTILTNAQTVFTVPKLVIAPPNAAEVTIQGASSCSTASQVAANSVVVMVGSSFTQYPPQAADVVSRVNIGGPALVDPTGVKWNAESGFTGGILQSTTSAISGTSRPAIFQTTRYNIAALSFVAPSLGSYLVRLSFVELFWNAAGKRLFDIQIQNVTVASNLDIFARVGKFAALTLSYRITLRSSRNVEVKFVNRVDSSALAAAELLLAPATPPPVTTTPAATTPKPTATGPVTPVPTLPVGYYHIEKLNVPNWQTGYGFVAACNAALRLPPMHNSTRRTVVIPEATISAQGFAMGNASDVPIGYIGILIPSNIDLLGAGPRKTIFQVAPNTITSAQATTWSRLNQPYPATNQLRVLHLMGTAGGRYAQFGVRGTQQKVGGQGVAYAYNGITISRLVNPVLEDILVQGIPGYANIPPGETSSISFYRTQNAVGRRLEVDGRDYISGAKVAAAGFALNSADTVTLYDCHAHHAGFSHGFAFWQTKTVTTYNCTSDNNGSPGTAASGTVGVGFNHEKTWNTKHYSPRVGFNTLSELRYYATNSAADAWTGNTKPHAVFNLVVLDGGALNVRLDKDQCTKPTFVASPTPVYAIEKPVPTCV